MRTEKRYSLVNKLTLTKETVHHARHYFTEEDPGNKENNR